MKKWRIKLMENCKNTIKGAFGVELSMELINNAINAFSELEKAFEEEYNEKYKNIETTQEEFLELAKLVGFNDQEIFQMLNNHYKS
jgi:hypothetical protein